MKEDKMREWWCLAPNPVMHTGNKDWCSVYKRSDHAVDRDSSTPSAADAGEEDREHHSS